MKTVELQPHGIVYDNVFRALIKRGNKLTIWNQKYIGSSVCSFNLEEITVTLTKQETLTSEWCTSYGTAHVNLAVIHKNMLFLKTAIVQHTQRVLTPAWHILVSIYTAKRTCLALRFFFFCCFFSIIQTEQQNVHGFRYRSKILFNMTLHCLQYSTIIKRWEKQCAWVSCQGTVATVQNNTQKIK